MRMISLALSAACLFAASGCAQTDTASPQTAGTGAGQASAEGKQQICKDEDAGPSSRLATVRVCHTQEEWNKLEGRGR